MLKIVFGLERVAGCDGSLVIYFVYPTLMT